MPTSKLRFRSGTRLGLPVVTRTCRPATSVVTPVMILLIVGYVLGVSILPSTPGSGFVATLSLIPIFAPTLMPIRLALGVVPAWQAAVSLAGMIVIIPLLLWLSARIYQNAVLRSGARVKLRDAILGRREKKK